MEYNQFEMELRNALTTGNGTKLLYKIIDAPFRFFSPLQPFNFKVKLEQSFLRNQENTYVKYIKFCAEYLISQYGFSLEKSNFKYTLEQKEGQEFPEDIKVNATMIFKQRLSDREEGNEDICVVYLKKRDFYGAKEVSKIHDNIIKQLSVIRLIYPNNKIKGILWFLDNDYNKNINFFNECYDKENTFGSPGFRAYYGAEFFKLFDKEEDWLNIESHIRKFKSNNYDYFLKMPNLDQDEDVLNAMINLNERSWQKLISPEEVYKDIRQYIFDERNENSNLFKALKLREIKQTSIDDDEEKRRIIELQNSTTDVNPKTCTKKL
ncbi:hypothetical protein NPA07_00850 [Mycoplasmopsis caviae]|uniref:Uncharacterized protein n=1 Tax=Mycoplasmopsis caviae TaxID=55603 RepID=A0A3P8KB59_9BACT|nr:hypothetical protein [Mycoplasmopsis caviae]UUD35409.1 hypothetical protein NPA07_00850 [Mycoplasmopsis caviae]VDR41814.1 Uncharacterised protein [Mycoplasmopsis caviae]